MANQEQLEILKQGVEVWNQWRINNENKKIDLSEANLEGINLSGDNFMTANLIDADLTGAYLDHARLIAVNLSGAKLKGADLCCAVMNEVNLEGADLTEAYLGGADLSSACLFKTKLTDADLSNVFMPKADLREANLTNASLEKAVLIMADLTEANLSSSFCSSTEFMLSNLTRAILCGTDLTDSSLLNANLNEADLTKAVLTRTNLTEANLTRANLTGANLEKSICNETNFSNANIEDANVYGTAVWDIKTNGLKQNNLIITKQGEPVVTVDDLEVAQFIYLLLNNNKIRNVLGTIAKKGVLILGRFTPERKKILDAIRDKLRELGFLPMMFDFDKVASRDFTETIQILAGMSRFVIADITQPKSSPLELQAVLPDYKIPFVPIIEAGERPFAMFRDLTIYPWCLDVRKYKSEESLMKAFQKSIVDRALDKEKEILALKNRDQNDIKDIGDD